MPATPVERLAAAAALVRPADGRGAWNPLALARTALVVLPPDGPPPPALHSVDGARHPLQVAAEGWLVQLALPALAGTVLVPTASVPGARWEVSATVLDNGRVRAEFDPLGRLVRLCWDGVFADLAGAACVPLVDGREPAEAATVQVEEAGPVRARLRVRRGGLDLAYSLLALDDHLLVEAAWQGPGDCRLAHPVGGGEALCAGDGPLRPPAAGPQAVRRALLADAGGRGLALVAGMSQTVSCDAGALLVAVAQRAAYALAAPRRGTWAMSLGQLAEHLALPLQPGTAPGRPPVRLTEAGALAPLWAGRMDGWDGELLLAEQAGARQRAWLMAESAGRGECWSCGGDGTPLARCPASPEGGGWRLDLGPGEIQRVRWRLPAPAAP